MDFCRKSTAEKFARDLIFKIIQLEREMTQILAVCLLVLAVGALLRSNLGWKFYVVLGMIALQVAISTLWERRVITSEITLLVLAPTHIVMWTMLGLMFREGRRANKPKS